MDDVARYVMQADFFRIVLESADRVIVYIDDSAAPGTHRMVMMLRIAIVPRLTRTRVDFPDEAGTVQHLEITVHRSQTDTWHDASNRVIHHIRTGVVDPAAKLVEDELSLPGHSAGIGILHDFLISNNYYY